MVELVQIDTLFVNVRPGRAIKHFTVYDPVAKNGRSATEFARAAKALLDKLRGSALQSQGNPGRRTVDGGFEFLSVFEDHCSDNGLELLVLPPKRPDLNGCVERP